MPESWVHIATNLFPVRHIDCGHTAFYFTKPPGSRLTAEDVRMAGDKPMPAAGDPVQCSYCNAILAVPRLTANGFVVDTAKVVKPASES